MQILQHVCKAIILQHESSKFQLHFMQKICTSENTNNYAAGAKQLKYFANKSKNIELSANTNFKFNYFAIKLFFFKFLLHRILR